MSTEKVMVSSSDDIELAEKVRLSSSDEGTGNLSVSTSESKVTIDKESNICIRALTFPALILSSFFKQYPGALRIVLYGCFVVAYAVYFIIALCYDADAAIPLIIVTAVVVCIIISEIIMKYCRQQNCSSSLNLSGKAKFQRAITVVAAVACIAFALWLLVDVILRNPRQLISLLGFFIIVFLCICGSKYPQHINWKPVIWGVALQFILGLLVLRTNFGYSIFKFVGDQVATFMTYSDSGSSFVFGDNFKMHFFAFKVLPMIVFFSTVTNMLYYLGVMQWFIGKLSYGTQITLGTSAIESTVAVANIFVGMTEAPLVVRPYLPELTKAEIHSVLTAGLGSIAFSVFGVYVSFGVDNVHLLTACVMSAPASLVVSRMLYPEREKSKFNDTSALSLQSGTNRNIVEAAAAGASMSIKLVANIAANLIAFLALLAFINASLSWFGAFVGQPELSFQMICSYLFMPVAFLMGADWEDCFLVGQLFGMKTFLNEFIAYESMKPYIHNRLDGLEKYNATTGDILCLSHKEYTRHVRRYVIETPISPSTVDLVRCRLDAMKQLLVFSLLLCFAYRFVLRIHQFLEERSEVIAIHALCGFCNVSSLGIIIGGLSVLMPTRKTDVANMAVRSLIGGMLTCCMTASIAGFLFKESSSAFVNATEVGNLTNITMFSTTFSTNTFNFTT